MNVWCSGCRGKGETCGVPCTRCGASGTERGSVDVDPARARPLDADDIDFARDAAARWED